MKLEMKLILALAKHFGLKFVKVYGEWIVYKTDNQIPHYNEGEINPYYSNILPAEETNDR